MSKIIKLVRNFILNSPLTTILPQTYQQLYNEIKELIHQGENVNDIDNNKTALIYAAAHNDINLVELLIKLNANIHHQDICDRTPLCVAAYSGHNNIVTLLINSGANIHTQDLYNRTPLCLAAFHGHDAVVKTLLQRGANINHEDTFGKTALMYAAFHGHDAVVKTLLQQDANINHEDAFGKTALIYAVESGNADIVSILLNYGANLNLQDQDGKTALMYATEKNYANIVQILEIALENYQPCIEDEPVKTASEPDKQTIACFALALLASCAIAAIGVLALCGISCHFVICVAIVSCFALPGLMYLLDKQNTQRQETDIQNNAANPSIAQPDKIYPQRWLVGLLSLISAACVVFHMFSLCPPILLVVIGILSIISLSINCYARKADKMLDSTKNQNR
jgi:ankyrin repeat protein